MKPFERTSNGAGAGRATPEVCAALLIEAMPLVMRTVRTAIGQLETPSLTIPQFRTLHFVQDHSGASLSAVAEFLGLTLPSTSKLVDHMVRQGILSRHDDESDRRRMILRLTTRGGALLKSADALVQRQLAEALHLVEVEDLATLQRAMNVLKSSFPCQPAEANGTPGGTLVTAGEPKRGK